MALTLRATPTRTSTPPSPALATSSRLAPDACGLPGSHAGVVPERADLASRTCVVCGREMTWRKAWERSFAEVRYCSSACRRARLGAGDEALEHEVLAALRSRRRGAVIDPEETVPGERESVRRAVRRLAARGEVQVVQAGRVVDPSHARGRLGVRLPT